MVKALHAAGIEVILDVVYNHTAEGNHLGPTLSLRGIDNLAYYRTDRRTIRATTWTSPACGNSLNMRHPHVLQLIMDSLRYWVTEMHVDGFRFDLAATLARELLRGRPAVGLLRHHPPGPDHLAGQADRRAVGPRRGRLPGRQLPGAVVRVERAISRHGPRLLARRAGHARRVRLPLHRQHRPVRGRRPPPDAQRSTSSPPTTASRLQDLVSYNDKHNEANGEDEPRRRERQPLVELRRGGSDRRPRHHRAARAPETQSDGDAAALAGRADAARRRRARPHAGRQQQRLLPGQRDQLDRLGTRPTGGVRRVHPPGDRPSGATSRCCVAAASSRDAGSAGIKDIAWLVPTAPR